MKVMILAAGRGERMRPLTDRVPKPLLEVAGKPLIRYHIEALRAAGFRELVINHAHLGRQIVECLGNGLDLGVHIQYSPEPPGALETGGGIRRALPLLGEGAFLVINGDIWTDYPYRDLPRAPGGLAHLVLVDNPEHHREGDFRLQGRRVVAEGEPRLTFTGIGVYRPELFAGAPRERFPLGAVLRTAIRAGQVSGEHYRGRWMDIGTPRRLAELDRQLRDRKHG
ncbi:MAG: nucleotidyltransferase family protein [Gammaproteobacteria bacterium]|jgi:MurNAc alpha-1-phosphate uridylyltransferase